VYKGDDNMPGTEYEFLIGTHQPPLQTSGIFVSTIPGKNGIFIARRLPANAHRDHPLQALRFFYENQTVETFVFSDPANVLAFEPYKYDTLLTLYNNDFNEQVFEYRIQDPTNALMLFPPAAEPKFNNDLHVTFRWLTTNSELGSRLFSDPENLSRLRPEGSIPNKTGECTKCLTRQDL
jgi:hypothetical protein